MRPKKQSIKKSTAPQTRKSTRLQAKQPSRQLSRQPTKQTLKQETKKPFPFLTLPLELRDKIYSLIIAPEPTEPGRKPRMFPGILPNDTCGCGDGTYDRDHFYTFHYDYPPVLNDFQEHHRHGIATTNFDVCVEAMSVLFREQRLALWFDALMPPHMFHAGGPWRERSGVGVAGSHREMSVLEPLTYTFLTVQGKGSQIRQLDVLASVDANAVASLWHVTCPSRGAVQVAQGVSGGFLRNGDVVGEKDARVAGALRLHLTEAMAKNGNVGMGVDELEVIRKVLVEAGCVRVPGRL